MSTASVQKLLCRRYERQPGYAAMLLRMLVVLFRSGAAAARFSLLVVSSGRARRNWRETAGCCAASLLKSLGPSFIKIGQILSARPDLLPTDVAVPLSVLQDRVEPAPRRKIERVIESALGRPIAEAFAGFDPVPFACASIAQVHQAVMWSGQRIALKVKRPGVDRAMQLDVATLRWIARAFAVLPLARLIPFGELVEEVAVPLESQLDFLKEASNQRRFRRNLRQQELIEIPALVEAFCTNSTIGMELVENGGAVSESERRRSVVAGLRALYRMIFFDGFVHADLHPGNLLFRRGGGLVLLDMGLVAELSPADRDDFTDFFFGLVNCEGDRCASILLKQAAYIASYFNEVRFRADVEYLIVRHSALKSREFNIAAFVGEMIAIQRHHGMRGSVKFIMTVLAMAVFDGICKQHYPDCDFQAEARPYLILSRFGSTVPLKVRP
jgi:ubiquinone biosynthesis protein